MDCKKGQFDVVKLVSTQYQFECLVRQWNDSINLTVHVRLLNALEYQLISLTCFLFYELRDNPEDVPHHRF